jgi:VWFA-related protein
MSLMSRTEVLLHKCRILGTHAQTFCRAPACSRGCAAVAAAPGRAGEPDQTARFGARTEAVVVDVTVVDKKGRPVTTLAQSDFEVFETASRRPFSRSIGTCRTECHCGGCRGGARPRRSESGVPRERAWPVGHGDRLRSALAGRTDARVSRREAFVQNKQADELAGVFIVDQALRTLAPYTTDPVKLAAAVEQAAETATTQLAHERTMAERYTVTPETPFVAGAEDQGRFAGMEPGTDPLAKITDPGERAVAQMILRMENSYRDMLYEMQGHAAIDSLLALVDSMSQVPGRKAVIYFCEGLTIPPSVEPKYRSIIYTANRSNVTVYTVDAAGLRVHSDQASTSYAITQYGAQGVGDVPRGDKYLQSLEDNERSLKQDPAVSLGILAEQTGGSAHQQHQRSRERHRPHQRGSAATTTCSATRRRTRRSTASSIASR